mgnify:CR=1 FL=1
MQRWKFHISSYRFRVVLNVLIALDIHDQTWKQKFRTVGWNGSSQWVNHSAKNRRICRWFEGERASRNDGIRGSRSRGYPFDKFRRKFDGMQVRDWVPSSAKCDEFQCVPIRRCNGLFTVESRAEWEKQNKNICTAICFERDLVLRLRLNPIYLNSTYWSGISRDNPRLINFSWFVHLSVREFVSKQGKIGIEKLANEHSVDLRRKKV